MPPESYGWRAMRPGLFVRRGPARVQKYRTCVRKAPTYMGDGEWARRRKQDGGGRLASPARTPPLRKKRIADHLVKDPGADVGVPFSAATRADLAQVAPHDPPSRSHHAREQTRQLAERES